MNIVEIQTHIELLLIGLFSEINRCASLDYVFLSALYSIYLALKFICSFVRFIEFSCICMLEVFV